MVNSKSKQKSKKKNNKIFNSTEREIIKYLFDTKGKETIYGMAKVLNISYPTAKKYMKTIEAHKIVKVSKKNKTKLYFFDLDAYLKDN